MTKIRHTYKEKGILAFEQAKLINKPLYYNQSGGCGVTHGLRMFGIYHHGPFDWVMSKIKSNWDLLLFIDDIKNQKIHRGSKPTHWWTDSQNCCFIHEDLSDQNVRNKLLKRAKDLEQSIKSNMVKPIRLDQNDNVALNDLLWVDRIDEFKELFISLTKDQIDWPTLIF